MRTQPKRGLRRFISTMAAMSSGPLGPGLRRCDEEEGQVVLTIHQRPVRLEQCSRLDEGAKFHNPARAHEQCGQCEHEAID